MTELTWKSYGYYSGNGTYGSATAGNWMQYADFFYGTDRYRAVRVSGYRPNLTSSPNTAGYSNMDENGYTYESGKTYNYLFKWEPIKWRVLNPSIGLVVSESVLDAQPFHNTPVNIGTNFYTDSSKKYYANEFIDSSLRTWLSNTFYANAFTSTQKNNIVSTPIAQYENEWLNYTSPTVYSPVFPLSYGHVISSSLGHL